MPFVEAALGLRQDPASLKAILVAEEIQSQILEELKERYPLHKWTKLKVLTMIYQLVAKTLTDLYNKALAGYLMSEDQRRGLFLLDSLRFIKVRLSPSEERVKSGDAEAVVASFTYNVVFEMLSKASVGQKLLDYRQLLLFPAFQKTIKDVVNGRMAKENKKIRENQLPRAMLDCIRDHCLSVVAALDDHNALWDRLED